MLAFEPLTDGINCCSKRLSPNQPPTSLHLGYRAGCARFITLDKIPLQSASRKPGFWSQQKARNLNGESTYGRTQTPNVPNPIAQWLLGPHSMLNEHVF